MIIKTQGLTELGLSLEKIADIPDSVLDAMLEAQASVVVQAQKKYAQTMLKGPYYKGGVANSVTKGKPTKTSDGKQLEIYFAGKQHGNDLSEIAFINEYGKRNQPARPFIRTANEASAGEAVEKAADVLAAWQKDQ